MAKSKSTGVNKSQAIRDVLAKNPASTAKEAMDALKAQGIKVDSSLFYFVKGKMVGRRGRRRKMRRQVQSVMVSSNGTAAAKSDVLATINKIKGLASEVGGLKKLGALVEALIGV